MCYTKDNRLFGEKSATFLKQNLDTSYNNLSRLICYDSSLDFYKEECQYSLKKSSENYNFYFLNKENEKKEIKSDKIISDYLNLINDYFFNKEKIQYDKTSISVPDFYSSNQKQVLRLICEGIGMKDLTLYNESSAITMYYGYTKYRDLFLNEDKKIDPIIEKNILFIDAGYSKTSLIISNFKYNEFKVEYVLCDYNLGGRNLDYSIAQFCMKNFKRLNNIEKIDLNDKMKYRLIEEIKKSRIKLTINDDILISIDSFYNKLDLNVELTKSKFNEIKFLVIRIF
jgi:molecular chaperone DnaK (HSP70)